MALGSLKIAKPTTKPTERPNTIKGTDLKKA
jgi:hypothetical protein